MNSQQRKKAKKRAMADFEGMIANSDVPTELKRCLVSLGKQEVQIAKLTTALANSQARVQELELELAEQAKVLVANVDKWLVLEEKKNE